MTRGWVVVRPARSPFLGPIPVRRCWTRLGALACALWRTRGKRRGTLEVVTVDEYVAAWSRAARCDYAVTLDSILRAGRIAGVYLIDPRTTTPRKDLPK